jgi:chromosome segregation ATPase
MFCGILKGVIRVGLIAALAGGAVAVVAGPHRVGALVDQVRGKIQTSVDALIDDPIALRAQLRELEGQYPARIAEVRGDLDEVTRHLAQLENIREESLGVVELTSADIDSIQGLIQQGEQARAENGQATIVRVKFNSSTLNMSEAYGKANRLTQIRDAYQTRATELDRDIGYVTQQKDRLGELLQQLETEQAEFRAQLWQLDRQVDTIARNERMIHILKKREARIDRQSRYTAGSLEQITGRLAQIRAEQEGKLEQFKQGSDIATYENAARFKINSKKAEPKAAVQGVGRFAPIEVSPKVIELGTPKPSDKSAGTGECQKTTELTFR